MPSRLLSEWQAFCRLEPFGFEAMNILAANICCAVLSPHCKTAPKLMDQMVTFSDEDRPKQSWEDMRRVLQEVSDARKR